jgi:hypothetical protein
MLRSSVSLKMDSIKREIEIRAEISDDLLEASEEDQLNLDYLNLWDLKQSMMGDCDDDEGLLTHSSSYSSCCSNSFSSILEPRPVTSHPQSKKVSQEESRPASSSHPLTPPSSPESSSSSSSSSCSSTSSVSRKISSGLYKLSNGISSAIVRVTARPQDHRPPGFISSMPNNLQQIIPTSTTVLPSLPPLSGSKSTTAKSTKSKSPRSMAVKANKSPEDLEADNKKRIHKCNFPDCKKVYTKSSHLKAHQRTHTGTELFYIFNSLNLSA